jgi:hypothetical protein
MLLAEAPFTIWEELQIFGVICGAPALVVAIVILLFVSYNQRQVTANRNKKIAEEEPDSRGRYTNGMARDEHDPLRETLISSLYSDKEAEALLTSRLVEAEFVGKLVRVCFPYDYYSNDPRMEAAYYLSQCPIECAQSYTSQIEELLRLPADGQLMNYNISGHLVKCLQRLVAAKGYVPSSDIAPMLETHPS